LPGGFQVRPDVELELAFVVEQEGDEGDGELELVFAYEASVVWAWRLWPRGVDINNLFPADERAYTLLSLMDERMPSQRNGIYFDATGHEDERRPDLEALMRRPEGVPMTPYDTTQPNSETANRSQGDQSLSG